MNKKWETKKAPRPSGKIAQVSRNDEIGIAYISGLIAQDADGNVIYGKTAAEETRIILENLKTIVSEMGYTLDNIIKTNIFLTDMNDFDEMNSIYSEYFSLETAPARQCVEAGVWGGLKVEISSVIALR